MTQNNLGTALAILGEWESDKALLTEAKDAIESVYGFYKKAGDSQYDQYFEKRLNELERLIK